MKGLYGSVGPREAARTPCLKGADQAYRVAVDLAAADQAEADLQDRSPGGVDGRKEQAEA